MAVKEALALKARKRWALEGCFGPQKNLFSRKPVLANQPISCAPAALTFFLRTFLGLADSA